MDVGMKSCELDFPCWNGVDVDQDGVGGDIVVDVWKRGNAYLPGGLCVVEDEASCNFESFSMYKSFAVYFCKLLNAW